MLSQYQGEGRTNLTLTKNNHNLDKTDKTANSKSLCFYTKRQLKDELCMKRHEIIIVSAQSKSVTRLDVVTMAVCEGGQCCGMCHWPIVYCYSVTPELDTATRAANEPSRSFTLPREGPY